MRAGLGVNKLDVNAKPVAAALNAALQNVAHVQFAPDLLHVEGLAFIGECRVARDHERARDAREVGREALGYAIDEILLLGIAA